MSPWQIPTAARAAVGICSAVLVLAFLAVGVVLSTYRAQDYFLEHTVIRSSIAFPDEPVTVRAAAIYTWVKGRGLNAMAAEPTVDGAEAPFELAEWPAPGQFMVSSDLAADVEELSARFGEFAGYLPESAVPSAHARVLLARPLVPMGETWNATGFGVAGPRAWDVAVYSGMLHSESIPRPLGVGVTALLLVVPSALLLATALGAALRPSDRARRALEVLGIEPAVLGRLTFRSLLPSVAWGVGVGCALAGALFLVDTPLPWATFTIRALDVRGAAGPVLLAVLGGVVVTVALVGVLARPGRLDGAARPRPAPSGRRRRVLAVVGVLGVAAASQGSAFLNERGDSVSSSLASLAVLGGMVVAIGTMRAVVGELLDRTGWGLARYGRRGRHAVPLVAGRSLVGSPGAARVAGTAGVMLVVISFAATWALLGQRPALEAREIVREIAGRYYTVSAPSGIEDPAAVLAVLPDGVEHLGLIGVGVEQPDGSVAMSTILRGSAAALDVWGLLEGEVTAAELPRLLVLAIGDPTEVVRIEEGAAPDAAEQEALGAPGQSYLVFRTDGGSVDRDATQRALSSVGGLGWSVSQGGEGYLIGANDQAFQARWLWWYGAIATTLVVGTAVVATMGDARQQAHRIAPLDTLFAPRRVGGRVVALRVAIVSLVGLAVGWAEGAALARISSGYAVTTIGASTIVAGIAVVVAVALVVIYTPLVLSAARISDRWDLQQDEWTDEES